MEKIISSFSGLILVSLIIYLLKVVLPNGSISRIANIAYSALIMLLLLQMFSYICTNNIFQFDSTVNIAENIEHIKQGIEQQINSSEGFENAQVTLIFENGCIDATRIVAYRSDNDDLLDFEKNKAILIKKLQVMYGIDQNKIIIEVI